MREGWIGSWNKQMQTITYQWIHNKVLLYRKKGVLQLLGLQRVRHDLATEQQKQQLYRNSIQYPEIDQNGKDCEKECVYTYS